MTLASLRLRAVEAVEAVEAEGSGRAGCLASVFGYIY